MAKLTLLEMVQDIANDLETDNVSSITDTVESSMIAQIIKTTFFELISNRNWPHLKRTMQFETDATATRPTHLQIPEEVKELISFSYNKRRANDTRDKYEYLSWLEPEEFLFKLNNRNSSNSNVDVISEVGGIDLNIVNDAPPQYFTSFDDEYIVCDSYDSGVDTPGLKVAKTQLILFETPTWTESDAFVPDLPIEAFPALLAEAKSTAFVVLKQQANEKAEQKAQRQHRWMSRKAWKAHGGVRYPNYGRKSHFEYTRKSNHFNPDFSV